MAIPANGPPGPLDTRAAAYYDQVKRGKNPDWHQYFTSWEEYRSVYKYLTPLDQRVKDFANFNGPKGPDTYKNYFSDQEYQNVNSFFSAGGAKALPDPAAPSSGAPPQGAPGGAPSPSGIGVGGDWEKQVRDQYPSWAAFLGIPDVAQVLKDAVAGGWGAAELQSKIQNTAWWKTTPESARNFQVEGLIDPATALHKIADQTYQVQQLAAQYGVPLHPDEANQYAVGMLRYGWSQDEMIRRLVERELRNQGDSTKLTGKLGQIYEDVQGLAAQYTVPMGDNAKRWYTGQLAESKGDFDTLKAHLIQQAKSIYADPEIHRQLDEGKTVEQIADPFTQQAAQLLGLNPADINLNDAKWRKALNFVDDKGQRRMMTMDEWNTNLRTDDAYGYNWTQNARNDAAQMITQLEKSFGAGA